MTNSKLALKRDRIVLLEEMLWSIKLAQTIYERNPNEKTAEQIKSMYESYKIVKSRL